MAIPTKISELVERFDRNLEAYKQGKYNETQVRLEFINPFFEELGWDPDGGGGRCLCAGRLTGFERGRRTAIATALQHCGISWQERGAGRLRRIR